MYKKKLRNEKIKISGKVLIDKQVMEEAKRFKCENNCVFDEQMQELHINLERKDQLVKQFDKKLIEIEVYAKRMVEKGSFNKEFKNFSIQDYISTFIKLFN